jgi:hypothetical protein
MHVSCNFSDVNIIYARVNGYGYYFNIVLS